MTKNCQIADNIEIPFIPDARFEIACDNVSVWWFQEEFCQSKYGEDSKKGTNSCTLIVILTANKIANEKINTLSIIHRLPESVLRSYAFSILKANKIYADLDAQREIKNVNFNIPEGMEILSQYCSNNLQEWFFVQVHIPTNSSYTDTAGHKIFSTIRDGLELWNFLDFKKDYLFCIIIGESRSILLCFQVKNRVATIFDSHCHPAVESGAVVAQTEWKNLASLSGWIARLFKDIYNCRPNVFEISFLPVRG